MKILLINPPRSPHNAILDHATEKSRRFIHKKLIGPPLGLITIAAAVKQHHDVALIDMKGEYDLHPDAPSPEKLAEQWTLRHRPDIAGVTVITSEFNASAAIFASVKRTLPTAVTVAGGLHATLRPHDFAQCEVDVVVPGQAGPVFEQIAHAVARKAPLESIDGIYIRREGRLEFTRSRLTPINAAGSDFIMPDRSLLRPWLAAYRVAQAPGPTTYIFTSLGCPYRCSFCSIWPQFDGRFFQRSIDSIIEELAGLDDYPVVRFADANTTVDTGFIRSLFERIHKAGIRKEYVMDIRPDTAAMYPDLIELMAKAGLKIVISGFESYRAADLARWGKSISPADIQESVRVLHENGISVRGNYVIPPDYLEQDFSALAEWSARHAVALAGYTILTPMPGTPEYEQSQSDIIDFDLAKYNFFNCVMKTALPLDEFYQRVAGLWSVRSGERVI